MSKGERLLQWDSYELSVPYVDFCGIKHLRTTCSC
jgi:hypothetical protein